MQEKIKERLMTIMLICLIAMSLIIIIEHVVQFYYFISF
jgi:hypothetical protein